jgi:hypothetical protein
MSNPKKGYDKGCALLVTKDPTFMGSLALSLLLSLSIGNHR